MAKQRIFVDTNVIIEAFRAKCWKAICGRYSVETVSSVVSEALAGDPEEPGYVVVDEGEQRSGLSVVHDVTPLMRAALPFCADTWIPAFLHRERHGEARG